MNVSYAPRRIGDPRIANAARRQVLARLEAWAGGCGHELANNQGK
jgi:hypothetical protein